MNDLRNNFSLYFDFYSVVLYGGFQKQQMNYIYHNRR